MLSAKGTAGLLRALVSGTGDRLSHRQIMPRMRNLRISASFMKTNVFKCRKHTIPLFLRRYQTSNPLASVATLLRSFAICMSRLKSAKCPEKR